MVSERGFDEKGFAVIRSQGNKALVGASPLTIKVKDFVAELTSHNTIKKN